MKNFINSTQAAKMLGIAKSTLYKMTCANKIPFYRPSGKIILFREDELSDWIMQSRVSSHDEIQRQAERYCKGGRA